MSYFPLFDALHGMDLSEIVIKKSSKTVNQTIYTKLINRSRLFTQIWVQIMKFSNFLTRIIRLGLKMSQLKRD